MKTLQLSPPQPIKEIIEKLSEHYEVYYVGGCVRDFLLHREVHDYDAATNASVEEMKEILAPFRIIETGIRHGTLTIVHQHQHIEITTFRIDQNYLNHRSPENVLFTRSIHEDLKRRDFTINALACDPKGHLIDDHEGLIDLNRKLIRCIGDPRKRFSEDALRILRAVRFAYTFDFQIEKKTENALFECLPLLHKISVERKVEELMKILMVKDKNPYPILSCYHLFDYFDIKPHLAIGSAFESSPHDLECRIACLFFSVSYARRTMKKWHCSKKMIAHVTALLTYKTVILPNDPYTIRRLIYEYDIAFTEKILLYKKMDTALFHKIVDEQDYLQKLAISGDDCIKMGYTGKEISAVLKMCTEYVLHDLKHNHSEILLEHIKKQQKISEISSES